MLPAPLPPLPSPALPPEAAVVLAPGGLVLASSLLAAELFGCVPVGRTLDDLVTEPARVWAAIDGLPVGAHVPAIPLEGLRADGVPIRLDASARVLEGGETLFLLRELDSRLTSSLEVVFDHAAIGMALYHP